MHTVCITFLRDLNLRELLERTYQSRKNRLGCARFPPFRYKLDPDLHNSFELRIIIKQGFRDINQGEVEAVIRLGIL
jgi:hypothetical protein